MLNKSEEDWLVFRRIKRLPKMSSSDWQAAARQQITDLIQMVLNINRIRLDFEVRLVVNPLRHITTGPTLYNVRLDSVYTATRVREIYSGFFRKIRPVTLPPALKGVDVRNKITIGTKIRIAILHQLGSIYTSSNPGSSYQVRGFDPRPTLFTKPAHPGRPRSYNFIQAATTLKATFSDEHLIRIYQVVNNNLPGELRALFIVLNDDERDRCLDLVKADRERNARSVNFMPVQSTSGSGPSGAQSTSGVIHGSGNGMDVTSKILTSLSSPPPPPPPVSSDPDPELETALRPKTSRERERSVTPRRERSITPRHERSVTPRDRDRRDRRERSVTPSRDRRERSVTPSRDRRERSVTPSRRGTKRSKPAKKKSKRSRRYSSSSSSSGSGSSGSGSSSSSSGSARGTKPSKSKPKYKPKAKGKSKKSRN